MIKTTDIVMAIGTHLPDTTRANGREMVDAIKSYEATFGTTHPERTQDGELNLAYIAQQLRDAWVLIHELQAEVRALKRDRQDEQGEL